MKIHFYLRYSTGFGQNIGLTITNNGRTEQRPMEYLNQDFWHAVLEVPGAKPTGSLQYQYHLHQAGQPATDDWEAGRQLELADYAGRDAYLLDTWNDAGAYENAFATQPFSEIFFRNNSTKAPGKVAKTTTHEFRVKAPLLLAGESLCLMGSGHGLHDWSRTAPIAMQRHGDWWVARVDLSADQLPLAYKYGVWSDRDKKFDRFEDGDNRTLFFGAEKAITVLHDGFVRMPNNTFKGAGVAIPVFSLRSENSGGVGEFTDLHALTDWGKLVGLKLIQLLPVNDTAATDTWTDSYPYASISAFALHPLYLNLPAMAGKQHAALLKPFAKTIKTLNAADAVDYEGVLQWKWAAIRAIFKADKGAFLSDAAYQTYFEENRHWLQPYAAFCYLKQQNDTTDFNQWKKYSTYNEQEIAALCDPKTKHFDEVALHYFVQWHLHQQLLAATQYAHAQGLAVKGDIPIGIYRYSCDAWVAPELYNMSQQAGAPPDDFAEKGQNWGFPTYNWSKMKADGFAWWRQRFHQMSYYFDAFRIDHILGFFRIWSIPLDAVEGILGRFVPAIPVREQEFWQSGIGFNFERFCQPFITERVLWETFGDFTLGAVVYLQKNDTTGRYDLRPEFDTQRKIEAHFAALMPTDENMAIQQGLYDLLTNVILYHDGDGQYHFRFGIEKTTSFRYLDTDTQARVKALYVNYFYRRQDDFWQREALEKLPALKRSTNMLICGEDLGMVPDCVPDVMRGLGILSLEIQRMPKAPGSAFFHPKDAPYLSVVTPSTHDMSTLRGWWEEDRALTQKFYNEMLGQHGDAPFFCEPWINRILLEQHFYSPAMWSIFQLQDLMGMDGTLRREDPEAERINVPANPKHYWRYRMHLTLAQLQQEQAFNDALKAMVKGSGRG
jgi:4-alpha-glucanotransferase